MTNAFTKVTVAIPTYNRSRLLKEAIESALAQDYPNLCVAVLDNASSDDTQAVVRSIADPRLLYVRNETNIGCMPNWNRAIELNTSPYFCLFSDDDVMLPGFIRESSIILDENPNVAFSFTPAKYVDINRVPLGIRHTQDMPPGVSEGLRYIELLVNGRRCRVEPSAVMMRARALAEVGPFDTPHTRDTDDLNLWFRLAARYSVAFIPKELVEMRVHAGQLSEAGFRAGGKGYYGDFVERIDGISYLLQSERANDRSYRDWLATSLRTLHFNQSMQLHSLFPDLYYTWTERLEMAKRDLAALIPSGDTFVLVDDSQWGNDFVTGRRSISLMERDGVDWGRPPDDETAIRELERHRQAGTAFIVFGWPAFWWLDYYGELREYLSSRFRCVVMNSRMAAFDLRT
jgi:glycosyltransferase involved in cell wall biosynthesis